VFDSSSLLPSVATWPGSDFDIRRGPFLGFSYKKVDFTTYWLSPGSYTSAIVFAVTVNF
jgi:hypothetical protein